MLMDSGHGQASGEQIEPTNALLEGRVHGRLSSIGAKRDTSDLTKLAGSPHQTPQSRTCDTRLRRYSGLSGPCKHLRHGSPMLATSTQGQISCTASAISAKAGNVFRLACKKTRL